MRHVSLVGATGLLLGLVAAPAHADPVALDAACRSTSEALSAGGVVTSGGGTLTVAGTRLRIGSRLIDPSGTYGLLAGEGVRAKDRRAALAYLRAPRATAWVLEGRYPTATGWGTSYEQARQEAIGLPADCIAAAGGLVSRSGPTYQYEQVTVTLDAAGRLTTWSTVAEQRTFAYGTQSLDLPARPVAYARWQRASQAASLNATMRTVARGVAASADADPAAIDAALRTAIDPGRAVPLRLRELRSGTLIFARNPYTGTYHAWRVYVRDDEVRARRVAP
jgi:hypothetical protein